MSPHAGEMLLHEVAPRIRSAAPYAVRQVGCEDAEEIVQDTICLAARLYENAEKAGKTVTPGNIAYYALQHAKSGRRSYGTHTADPLHPSAQFNGRATLESLDEPIKAEEGFEELLLADVLSVEEEDPSMQAARNLDWEAFTATLNERCRLIVQAVLEGRAMREVAERLNIHPTTVLHAKTQLISRMKEFFGVDILEQIVERPQWRNNLNAHREYLACRSERMPA